MNCNANYGPFWNSTQDLLQQNKQAWLLVVGVDVGLDGSGADGVADVDVKVRVANVHGARRHAAVQKHKHSAPQPIVNNRANNRRHKVRV